MLGAGLVAAEIVEGAVGRGDRGVVLLDPALHLLEQLRLQRLGRGQHRLHIGVLRLQVLAHVGLHHRGVAQHRLPVVVLHPGVVVDPHAAELLDADGVLARTRRGGRAHGPVLPPGVVEAHADSGVFAVPATTSWRSQLSHISTSPARGVDGDEGAQGLRRVVGSRRRGHHQRQARDPPGAGRRRPGGRRHSRSRRSRCADGHGRSGPRRASARSPRGCRGRAGRADQGRTPAPPAKALACRSRRRFRSAKAVARCGRSSSEA